MHFKIVQVGLRRFKKGSKGLWKVHERCTKGSSKGSRKVSKDHKDQKGSQKFIKY